VTIVRRLRGGSTIAAALGLALAVAGCAPTHLRGNVSITSRTAHPVRLESTFMHGGYVVEPGGTSLLLSTVPLEAFRNDEVESAQVIAIHLLWEPWPGRTPVNAEATNLMIRHVVIAQGEIGVYGGGGFGWPKGTPGRTGLGIGIENSSVALLDSTPGFRDLLTPAVIRGDVAALLDEKTTIELRDAVSQYVTDRLGRMRWVDAGPMPESTPAPISDVAPRDRVHVAAR